MRAILAGGGTGGHVIPALAIAHELKERYNADVAFVGTARGIETRLVPKAGYPLFLVEVGGLKRVSLITRAKTLLALPRAVIASWNFLKDFRANVVIGVGGYASGPAMLAASLKGLPTLAFEPNVVPGFANRVIAPLATMAAVHFKKTQHYFRRSVVTGVPVRRAFFEIPPTQNGRAPSLLLFGGSQGAHALNLALTQALPNLKERVPGIHVVHQTGERDYEATAAAYLQSGISAEVSPFIDDMPTAFANADLLICRSGASTVAEVAASGKPAVFIPFPGATDDHQLRNAEVLSEAGAAVLLPERELSPDRLTALISDLLHDRERLTRMSAAARALSHEDAAGEIAKMAARLAGEPT